MDLLVNGATGYTGSEIADALVAAGHQVSGLARSDESARKLEERGIQTLRGDITDAESLREAAREADAVSCSPRSCTAWGPRRRSVPCSGPCSTLCGGRG
jgi:uncharacterized protein YbjT (DUF2867 family)